MRVQANTHLFVFELTEHPVQSTSQCPYTGIRVVPAVFTNTVWFAALMRGKPHQNELKSFFVMILINNNNDFIFLERKFAYEYDQMRLMIIGSEKQLINGDVTHALRTRQLLFCDSNEVSARAWSSTCPLSLAVDEGRKIKEKPTKPL